MIIFFLDRVVMVLYEDLKDDLEAALIAFQSTDKNREW